jgi:hypothetical protein
MDEFVVIWCIYVVFLFGISVVYFWYNCGIVVLWYCVVLCGIVWYCGTLWYLICGIFDCCICGLWCISYVLWCCMYCGGSIVALYCGVGLWWYGGDVHILALGLIWSAQLELHQQDILSFHQHSVFPHALLQQIPQCLEVAKSS